jgi:hypothetical protein
LRYLKVHIDSSSNGSVATAVPIAPAPVGLAGTLSETSSRWKHFWSIVEASLFYGILVFGMTLPFVAVIINFFQG